MSNTRYTKNYKKLKIAFFHNLREGGAKRVGIELCKRLVRNHIIDVYSLDNSSKKDFLFVNKVKIIRFKIYSNFFNSLKKIFFEYIEIHKKIAKEIDRLGYNIVLVNHDIFTKSPYILRFLKTPSIYFCHEPPREFYEEDKLFSTTMKYKVVNFFRKPIKYIDKKNVSYADIVLANSQYSKKRLKKIYRREIKQLKWGIDKKTFIWKKQARKNYFLSIGALAKFKGHDFIINCLKLLPKSKRFPLYIVAKGGRDEKFINNLANKNSIDLVIKRQIKDSELIDLYNSARLLLVGAHNEPFGLSSLEAMSCGCPVIGVAEGGIKEIVNKEFQGRLTNRNEKMFANAIINALNKKFNEKKIRNYVINKWKWTTTLNQLEKYIKALC